jgi:hypothetical protein
VSDRKGLNHRMAENHEKHLSEVYEGRRTRGSGNQFNAKADVRQSRYTEDFAVAVDGKATLGASTSVSRATWDKLVDDAGGEKPVLALRFFDTDRLDVALDLAVVSEDDLLELLHWARIGKEADSEAKRQRVEFDRLRH